MGTEIERKFLLAGDDWRESADGGTSIRQFYLAKRDGVTIRVRIRDESRAILTIKSGSGLRRGEYEYDIPLDDARELEAVRVGTTISKRRFRVPLGELTVEVDAFSGHLAPLMLAEIELPDEASNIDLPSWLGRDVTEDPRYTNAALAEALQPPDGWNETHLKRDPAPDVGTNDVIT